MPSLKALPNVHPDDDRKLNKFLKMLRAILKNIVINPVNIIPGRFHEMMTYSWSGIEELFEDVTSPSLPTENLGLIRESGLTSYHLDLKLEIFEQRHADLLDHGQHILWFTTYSTSYPINSNTVETVLPPESVSRPPELARHPREKNNPFWVRFRKLLTRFLSAGNVILGSLTKSLEHTPFGVCIEPIKEFVESMIESLEISDDYNELKQTI